MLVDVSVLLLEALIPYINHLSTWTFKLLKSHISTFSLDDISSNSLFHPNIAFTIDVVVVSSSS